MIGCIDTKLCIQPMMCNTLRMLWTQIIPTTISCFWLVLISIQGLHMRPSFPDMHVLWAHWSSLRSAKEPGKSWEWAGNPRQILQGSKEQARLDWSCDYNMQCLYMEWDGYRSLYCHMQPPSSKQCPHRTATLQAYEREKHERKCPGMGDGSEVREC